MPDNQHVYILKAGSRGKVDPLYAARGIEGQKGGVSDAGVQAYVQHHQIGYAVYSSFLAAYIQATVTQKDVKACGKDLYFPFALVSALSVAMPLPPLCVEFGSDISSEQVKKVAEDVEGSFEVIGGKKAIIIRSGVTIAKAQAIVKHGGKSEGVTVGGTVTIRGMFAFLKVLKYVTGFLKTHVYPAVISPLTDGATPFYEVWNQIDNQKFEIPIAKPLFLKRSIGDVPWEPLKRKTRVAKTETVATEVPEPENFTWYRDTVRAKPSPKDFPFSGPPSSLPNLHGLCFPYFNGLHDPDFRVIPSVLSHWFLRNMGKDRKTCEEEFSSIKLGNTSWATTDAGMALQHLVVGVDLAMRTQTRLFVLIEAGEYLGFCLLGCDYVLIINGVEHLPVEPSKLASDAALVSTHAKLTAELVKKVNELDYQETVLPVELESSEILSPRAVIAYVRSNKRSDDEEKMNDIIQMMKGIRFPAPYIKLTPDSIAGALALISDPSIQIPADVPRFVTDDIFTSEDRIEDVMSSFGSSGFSFCQFKNGTPWSLGEKPEDSLPMDVTVKLKSGKEGKAMDGVLVSVKPLRACVADMRYVVDHGEIRQSQDMSGASKNIRYTGEGRTKLLQALRQAYYSRKAAKGADAEASRPKKKARIEKVVESVDFDTL